MSTRADGRPYWIPISDCLPATGEEVLFTTGNGFWHLGRYWRTPGLRPYWSDDGVEVDGVTHWMPVPAPEKIGVFPKR